MIFVSATTRMLDGGAKPYLTGQPYRTGQPFGATQTSCDAFAPTGVVVLPIPVVFDDWNTDQEARF